MASLGAYDTYLKGETGRKTRNFLKIIILCSIAAAAVSSRLFSVIRKLPIAQIKLAASIQDMSELR